MTRKEKRRIKKKRMAQNKIRHLRQQTRTGRYTFRKVDPVAAFVDAAEREGIIGDNVVQDDIVK